MKKEVKEKISVKPLRECLEKLPEDELKQLYKESLERVGERPKKITKEEIIEYVYGDIAAKYMASLLFLSPKEVKELEEEINGNFIGEISKILIDEYFIFKIEGKYYVSEELKLAIRKIKSKPMNKGKKSLIASYYIMSNGLLKIDKLIDLMKETGYDITEKEIIDIAKEYDFIIKNDIVYANEIAEQFNEENKLLKIKEKNKYKIISFEEALTMMSIIQKIKNSGAIQEILQKKVKDKEKLDEIAETLFNVISVDIRFIFNVDKVMEENNIELTVDESDNLIKLLGDLCYEVPSWSLNGYTPNEKYNDEEKEKKCNKKKSCFDDFSDNRKKEIYIIHYTDINGIIKIDKMVEILNEEHHLKTTKKEVTKIAKNCDATYIIEDYICFDDFDDETLEIVKGLKTFYNYKIIDDIDNLIQERNDNEDKLAAICSKYNINDWVIERIDYNIMYGIFSEKLLEEILKYHGIKMSSKKQHQLYQEIEPIINETRMWTLNGYKPSELENK